LKLCLRTKTTCMKSIMIFCSLNPARRIFRRKKLAVRHLLRLKSLMVLTSLSTYRPLTSRQLRRNILQTFLRLWRLSIKSPWMLIKSSWIVRSKATLICGSKLRSNIRKNGKCKVNRTSGRV
jgi:hypothetical protein